MHLQSFGNPSQNTDEKRGFVEVNLLGVPVLGDSSRIVTSRKLSTDGLGGEST